METDLVKIKEIAHQKEDENWEFRTFLKGYADGDIDAIVWWLYDKVSSQIDCKTCGNCCRDIKPVFDLEDARDMARANQLSADLFMANYLEANDELGLFNTKDRPCPFLKNNICSHYENRPKSCRSYPHLKKDDFVFRLIGVIGNYETCPIVFNVYEALKDRLYEKWQAYLDDDFSYS